MLDDESGSPTGTDPGARSQGTEDAESLAAGIDPASGGSSAGSDDRGPVVVGRDRGDGPGPTGRGPPGIGAGDVLNGHGELPAGDADARPLGFGATAEAPGTLDVDLSPFAPLLGMLDATEPEASPRDRPLAPDEGARGAYALELRAESMLQYAERGAQRTGALDRTEVGHCDDNRDVVSGRDEVEVDGLLDEHTGHGLVVVADEVELNVAGPLTVQAHLEDNIIMAGVMRDEFAGGTFITAAMSDDMAAGLGLRCTAPIDVWTHGLVGMEERPGTCAADGLLFELAGTLYEREYGSSAHATAVARHSYTVATTMKTGFRPLFKTALGVRNLVPGGGGGGGSADASPPASPPPTGGGEAAGATLGAAQGGGALGRGADDTDEIASVVRSVESASDAADVEALPHPASTADNLDELARVDVEGAGPRQVAEIYEQPVPPAAASAAEPEPAPIRTGPPTATSTRPPPPLDLTEPGTEGYDFGKAYGSLRDRHHFYRRDLNLRGNMMMGDALAEIDAEAIRLFENLGGSLGDVTGDYRSRTTGIVDALQQMAEQADAAGDAGRAADARGAIDEIAGMTHNAVVEFASRTDEFSGMAVGSQRGPIDPNIDTGKLKRWLEEQRGYAEAKLAAAIEANDMASYDILSKERDYFDMMIKSLDAGENPLNESGEQIAFVRRKVEEYYAKFAGETAAAEAEGYVFIPSRPPEEEHLDLFIEQNQRLIDTLSDPYYMRSASGRPPPLDPSALGTEGYDFRSAYDSLYQRAVYYREQLSFRGNFFTREHLQAIDAQAIAALEQFGGSADDIVENSFGFRTAGIHDALGTMADEAEAAGDVSRAADIRASMDEIAALVDGGIADVAARTDEFSSAPLGSQYAPIDRNIDTDRLRSWLQARMDDAAQRRLALPMDDEVAIRLVGREESYYYQMLRCLDEGVNPLAVSNEQIVVLRIEVVEPHHAQYADEIAAAAAEGRPPDIPRLSVEDEIELYARLQELLVEKLADPAFHRSAAEMADEAFATGVQARIGAGLRLEPDLRPPLVAAGPPQPLPAAGLSDDVGYIDSVRDRSFARSALDASEETLQRQAAGLAEGDASVQGRAPASGSEGFAPPESSPGSRLPPDNAAAPIVDDRTGGWVLEPYVQPDASATPTDGITTAAGGDAVSSRASDVSWESGVQGSGDAEVGPATRGADDAHASDQFRPASAPEDADPGGVDGMQHAPAPNDDGASGPMSPRGDAGGGEDANPTGAVSERDDIATAPSRGDGTGADPSGTASPVTPDTPDPVSAGATGNTPGADTTPGSGSAAGAEADGGASGSDLYDEPVSFAGRSLEGAPRSDGPQELARPLDGADVPVDDLPHAEPDAAEPARKSNLGNADGRPVPDTYRDVSDTTIDIRNIQAQFNKTTGEWSGTTRDSVWSGAGGRGGAVREANARWSEFAAAQRTSPLSFSDDPRQILYNVEYDTTRYSRSRGQHADLYRGVDPPNTLDRSQAAHYVPRPWGWQPEHRTGFGRLSQRWNEFPFSPREQIVNALSRGEALSPNQVAALESGLQGYRTVGGELSSSQYRAMADMIADLGDEHRFARWHSAGAPDERLVQLIEMLDYAAAAD